MTLHILRRDKTVDVQPGLAHWEEYEKKGLGELTLDQPAVTRKVLPIRRIIVPIEGEQIETLYAIDDTLVNDAWDNIVKQSDHWYGMWERLQKRVDKACFWRRLKYLFTGRL